MSSPRNNNINDSTSNETLSLILSDFWESNTTETIMKSSPILTTVLQNAMTKEKEMYRRIRLGNPKIQATIVRVEGAMNILKRAGFVPEDGEFLIYKPQNVNQQRDFINDICRALQAKVESLKAQYGVPTTTQTKKKKESLFLSEKERLLRREKIKAMKRAKKQARERALEHWKENKQDRKEKAERREALLQSRARQEAKEGLAMGIKIQTKQKAAPAIPKINPVSATDETKQVLAAAAKARMERTGVAAPTKNEDTNQEEENKDIEIPEEEDKKPAAKVVAAVDNNDVKVTPLEWRQFLKDVPRCDAAPGIKESSSYYQDTKQSASPKCLKKLWKELSSLGDLLPTHHDSSIWVRFDEESPQFIRALVAAVLPGPTPYSGGLFVLDIYVPSDYPKLPPRVRLANCGDNGDFSFGPNLYEDGTICLSLLWDDGEGHWIPGHSTIYQVLVSIQGMMLGVEHPFYLMRGGWEGDIKEGDFQAKGQTLTGKTVMEEVGIDNQAVLYEDDIRVGTVKYAMLDPLAICLDNDDDESKGKDIWKVFQPIIAAHFYTNRTAILAEVRKWMSDDLFGRKRSGVMAIDKLNRLLPQLESQFSKLSMPVQQQDGMEIAPTTEAKDVKLPAADPKPAEQQQQDDSMHSNGAEVEMVQDAETAEEKKSMGGGYIDVMNEKRRRMEEAAQQGDYIRAGQFQGELQRLERLQKSMEEAAKQNDFIRAGQLQSQLQTLLGQDLLQTKKEEQQQEENKEEEEEEDDNSGDEEMSDEEEDLAAAVSNVYNGTNMDDHMSDDESMSDGGYDWGSGVKLSAAPAPAPQITFEEVKSSVPPSAEKKVFIPPERLCRLRIRLPSDKSVMEDFERTSPLSAVYHRLSAMMANDASQSPPAPVAPLVNGGAFSQPLSSAGFTLLLTRPKREFNLEMHGTKSLEELNLVPSAALTVMMCSDRGVLLRGELESRLREAQGDEMDVEGLTYEGLVELTERVGAAAPAQGLQFVNLTRQELEQNSKRLSPMEYLAKLDNSMEEHGEDERRCPICLGQYDANDSMASLCKLTKCGHIFHSCCLETWLRTKSSCPLCKESICQ